MKTRADDAVIVNRREYNAQHGGLRYDENEYLRYDEYPSYVNVMFPVSFPRKSSNHNSIMTKEGEDLIPEQDVTVTPMNVSRFLSLRRSNFLACYSIFFNIRHKHAKEYFDRIGNKERGEYV